MLIHCDSCNPLYYFLELAKYHKSLTCKQGNMTQSSVSVFEIRCQEYSYSICIWIFAYLHSPNKYSPNVELPVDFPLSTWVADSGSATLTASDWLQDVHGHPSDYIFRNFIADLDYLHFYGSLPLIHVVFDIAQWKEIERSQISESCRPLHRSVSPYPMFTECCIEWSSGLATAMGRNKIVPVSGTERTSQWKTAAKLVHGPFQNFLGVPVRS